jgi:hypothetical protein
MEKTLCFNDLAPPQQQTGKENEVTPVCYVNWDLAKKICRELSLASLKFVRSTDVIRNETKGHRIDFYHPI